MLNNEIIRIKNAIGYSCSGLCETWRSEPAFRTDTFLVALGIILILILPFSLWQRILLFFSMSLILIAELINTAIETIINRISNDIHPLSKKAKDIGSATVFIAFIQASIVWVVMIFKIIEK